ICRPAGGRQRGGDRLDRRRRDAAGGTGRQDPQRLTCPYPAGVTRKYHLRTYGCQMNEHDSERIAGLLEADGMVATDDPADADVVVLNTCTIRENADNKLYGALGHLKALKQRNPGLQIAVGGCMAQKDQGLIQERAPHVDVVFGTHNVANAATLLERAALE